MKQTLYWLILLSGSLFSAHSQAVVTADMMMIRIDQAFPETMSTLQQAIKQQGYTVSRVQHVDVGLNAMGFKTDKYRIVFFGKIEEIQSLSNKYPELIPYLPLKIAIYSEGDETLIISTNPLHFRSLYRDIELKKVFDQWHSDLQLIFKHVQFSD